MLTQTRIDKWLWAARFYKTRQLAIKAIKNGKISINGNNGKPSSVVRAGDLVAIKSGPYTTSVAVELIDEQRGPAVKARTLYTETSESINAKAKLKELLAAQPRIVTDRQKPDKRKLRSARKLKRKPRA